MQYLSGAGGLGKVPTCRRRERKIKAKLWLEVIIIAAIIALCALRFLNLSADAPPGITRSGVLYTDEGWYSRNAVSHYLGGPWIVEGDFNPIVNMPVLQVVNYAFFKAFGMGLASARLPASIAFVLTLLFLFLALRKRLKREVLLLSLLLLSCNFLFFAFSRIAIAANLMVLLIVVSFYFSLASSEGRPGLNAALASLFFSLAVLSNTIGAFFFPVMLFIFWTTEEKRDAELRRALLKKFGFAFGVLVAVFGIYFLLVVSHHMEDFRYFNDLNIAKRIKAFGNETGFMKAVYVVKGSSLRQLGLSLVIYIGGMMSIIFVFASERLRRDPILLAMVLWVFFYIGIAALNGYAPPRYYVPVLIPLTVLLVEFVFWAPVSIEGKTLRPLLASFGAVLLLASFGNNTFKVARYVVNPKYTFLNMSKSIGEAVRSGVDESIIGHFANSISLEAHVPSYNDTYKTWDIDSLMTRYAPDYYVCFGPVEKANPMDEFYDSARYMAGKYTLAFVSKYDVLGNYYWGKPVYLYRIEPKKIPLHKSAFNPRRKASIYPPATVSSGG